MKFYRIEHKFFLNKTNNWYIGSWFACWKESPFNNSFKNKLSFYYQFDNSKVLQRFSRTSPEKLPVSWTEPSVGPARDPYLREWYFNQYVKQKEKYVFGTCSFEQMKPWINNEALELLHENNFVLRTYKSRYVLNGLRQSVLQIDKPCLRLKEYSLKKLQNKKLL